MKALSDKELENIKAFVRATDYLSVAQLYLKDNPLLREKLTMEHIKPNVVGHWGTAPGQNFIYAHLNRIINRYDLCIGSRTWWTGYGCKYIFRRKL